MKEKNTFVAFLSLLKVKHTQSFSDQYFNEHPHKNNLFGLSNMLSNYGVENAAIRIEKKENDIFDIQTPFIAQFSGEFVAVHKIESDNVAFHWKGDNHVLAVTKFIEAWSGIVLLVESSEKSSEPDYKTHKRSELVSLLKKIAFFAACGLIAIIAFLNNNGILSFEISSNQFLYNNTGITLLLLINFAGLYISWLLLLKQIHIESQYADKICSLFKQKDCNNVLESEAAKLFGIIGWSEIGFGYFLTNVLILLLNPALVTYIALINILTLPYAFWSVWYQKAKAKQWCVLCLIVQVLLWVIFVVNLLWGYIQLPTLTTGLTGGFIPLLLAVGSCYFVSILGVNMLVPKLNTDKSVQELRQSINSMKADEAVFITLLKQQPFYETSDFNSVICFGNHDSKLRITILSNPYCNPCAKMHKRIVDLLEQVNNEINVQYIFSSFHEKLNTTNKYLIAAFLKHPSVGEEGEVILSNWFEKGTLLKDDYFKNMALDMDNPSIEIEFQKHEAWKVKTQLRSTPTILVNGFQLPGSYKIGDLRYFTDLDL